MEKTTNLKSDLKQRLDKTGGDAQNGIKWLLAVIDQGKADSETLLNLSQQLSGRLSMFESILEELREQLEKEQMER